MFQMTLEDWAKYARAKRLQGEDTARSLYPGALECQPCGKKLPYPAQIDAHLRSAEHRTVCRAHLIDNMGYSPKAPE